MLQEPQAKNVRKGTKSCLECRHRKTRCVWPSDQAEACQSCLSRGRTCELQKHMIPTSNAIHLTSRVRIEHLEKEVSSLWAVVRNLEAKLGATPIEATTRSQPQSLGKTPSSRHGQLSDEDMDSDASELSPPDPPSHILQLFENGLLGSDASGSFNPLQNPATAKAQRTADLRRLLPSRDGMRFIASKATLWINILNSLFPMSKMKSSDELLSQYDKLQDPGADTVSIAALLLYIALTAQQAPDIDREVESIPDVPMFIKDVSDTVELVVSDDVVVGTLEGIQMILLFLRLQLGRTTTVRRMCLLTRRIITLAELIGLPRAAILLQSYENSLVEEVSDAQPEVSPSLVELWRQKATVWEEICTTDRITSVMWSLPLVTINHSLPKRPITDSYGRIDLQSYLYHVADLASHVLEQDNIFTSGRSPAPTELLNAVIRTDQELRSLTNMIPKSRWRVHWTSFEAEAVLQYWHQYLNVRAHLQLALKYNESQEYAFNFITCLEASQQLARRYISLRGLLPPGFFASRVLDLQVFTATIFLLLSSYRAMRSSGGAPSVFDINTTTDLVEQVVLMMEFAAGRAGGEFARQAAGAVRSLSSLLQDPQTCDSQKITLNLALVGRIHVYRKSSAAKTVPTPPYPTPTHDQQESWQTTNSSDGFVPAAPSMSLEASNIDFMDSLSYSMEIPEGYPFFADEMEQWLTWTGGDGNV